MECYFYSLYMFFCENLVASHYHKSRGDPVLSLVANSLSDYMFNFFLQVQNKCTMMQNAFGFQYNYVKCTWSQEELKVFQMEAAGAEIDSNIESTMGTSYTLAAPATPPAQAEHFDSPKFDPTPAASAKKRNAKAANQDSQEKDTPPSNIAHTSLQFINFM